VVISNNTEQSIADRPFTLAVDGRDSTNEWDLINATCATTAGADQADTSVQTITARPNINDAIAPAPTAAPTTFIPKN